MKTQLKSGAELDVLTKEELRAELRSAVEYFVSGYMRPPSVARPEGGAMLNGSGAGIAELYVVDPGMIFRLTRLYVTVGSATGVTSFSAPLTASGGLSVYRGIGNTNDEIDGTPFATLPQVATWSRSYAPYFRDGESVRVGITGGPANGQLFCRGAGFFDSLIDREVTSPDGT